MKKKRLLALVGMGAVCLSAALIYWFYFAKPEPFPTNEQLLEEINRLFPEADASTIQDAIFLDERHVFVPFMSNEDEYGLSYWAWQKRKWNVVSINTAGQPQMWKVNRKDPSTYYFVWNIHPDDQLSYVKFYLRRDRGYRISEGIEHYEPSIQIEEKASLDEKSYGVKQLPDEWATFLTSFMEVESAKQPDGFFNSFFLENYMYFGWISYNRLDQETYPERSVNGSGFSNGTAGIEYLPVLDGGELELRR